MINYYEILGLKNTATAHEIKLAFRALAKLYHPDKNPVGKEQFSKILMAYETLSNPDAKVSYDYRLEYFYSQQKKSTISDYDRFKDYEEKELKRRRYYEEHIKKYEKKTHRKHTVEPEIKENYNEFKYILFATPLAVILFLLIVNLASDDRNFSRDESKTTNLQSALLSMPTDSRMESSTEINTVVTAGGIVEEYSGKKLTIQNVLSNDIELYLLNEQGKLIRKVFIKSHSEIELTDFQTDALSKGCCLLSKYPNTKHGKGAGATTTYLKNNRKSYTQSMKLLTLSNETLNDFNEISEPEFLSLVKAQHD